MTKKERIRILIGVGVMVVIFVAIASIGWTQDECLITYYYGFDGKYETHTVKKGYQRKPLEPGRYGHVFDGWYYTDKQGNEVLFDFETERVTRDLELTAHWVPFETELILALPDGHGECEVDSIMLPYGSEFQLPEAEREGYYFAGWQYYSGMIISSGVWDYPEDICRVYARWSKFKPGTAYFLGEYEQNINPDGKKEPIEWVPIDKKDGKYLLVSKYTLDVRSLGRADGRGGYVRWADCTLRTWLNGEFYDEAFTDAEKEMICDFYDAELGTTDRVFLPSLDEARLLVGIDQFGVGTIYANQAGLYYVQGWSERKVDGRTVQCAHWLTRSFRSNRNWTASAGTETTVTAKEKVGIRPAIWVNAAKLTGR